MTNKHVFTPGVVQIRHRGAKTTKSARCAICGQPGREYTRERRGRTVTFWQHTSRPEVEPDTRGACEWMGTGRTWCCRKEGHTESHHVHRGPRRNGVA